MRALKITFSILLALALITPLTDSDVFFSLSLGRLLVDGGLPTLDPYLYTHKIWSVWHQWLSYLIFYFFYSVSGLHGLIFLRIVVWLGIFRKLWRRARLRTVPSSLTFILLFAAAVVCTQRFMDRASIFSDFLFVILLLKLLSRPKLSRWNLFSIPLIFVLWVNLHPGFLLGLAVYSLFVLCQLPSARLSQWISLTASYGACLLNPKFLQGALYPVTATLDPAWKVHRTMNLEWQPSFQPPFLQSLEAKVLISLLLLSGLWALVSIWKSRGRNLFPFVLWFVLVGIGQDASRFMSTAALGSALLILNQWQEFRIPIPARVNTWASRCLAAGFAICSIWIWHNGYGFFYGHQPIQVGLDERSFPVKAVQWIKDKRIEGRFFNQYEWGNYLIWELNRPDSLFIHTFVADPALLTRDYYGINQSREVFLNTVNRFEIEYFLLDRKILIFEPRPRLLDFLQDWTLIYEDGTAVLWKRPAIAGPLL